MSTIQREKIIEETNAFLPNFGKINDIHGVMPFAVQNFDTGEIILIAYVNREALQESIKSKRTVFRSTSRNELWVKGATSGNYFELIEVFINCEQNSFVYKVKPYSGGICHTENKAGEPRNCFYRRLKLETMQLENINP